MPTIRVAPWPGKVPFTSGDTRTVVDVLLYLAALGSLVVAFVLPPVGERDLVRPEALWRTLVVMVVLGLRDKTIFLAARSEQYLPAILFYRNIAVLPAMAPFIPSQDGGGHGLGKLPVRIDYFALSHAAPNDRYLLTYSRSSASHANRGQQAQLFHDVPETHQRTA